jgi:hypothetical protein
MTRAAGTIPSMLSGVAALAGVFGSSPSGAQEISEPDAARVKAAIVIGTFDELDARCARAGGYSGAQREEVERWVTGQGVPRLRTHLDGAGLSAPLREQVRVASGQIIQQVASATHPCVAAVGLTRTRDAQFGDKLPQLLAGSTSLPDGASAPANPAKPTARPAQSVTPATGVTSGNAARLAADIEGFGFDSCTRVGYGGMVMFVPCPVVLFKNGTALTDVEGLNHPQGIAAHRASRPDKWTQWRRQGERVQLMKSKGWDNITYSAVYSTLPRTFRLDGRYHSSSGTGNTAVGGGDAVIAWSDYLFRPDGTVQRDGGAGSSSAGSGASVTTASTAASRTGRYRVEGLILAIDYDDGSKERRVIIADPKDEGRGTMWLDGEGYVYKK